MDDILHGHQRDPAISGLDKFQQTAVQRFIRIELNQRFSGNRDAARPVIDHRRRIAVECQTCGGVEIFRPGVLDNITVARRPTEFFGELLRGFEYLQSLLIFAIRNGDMAGFAQAEDDAVIEVAVRPGQQPDFGGKPDPQTLTVKLNRIAGVSFTCRLENLVL